MSSWNNPYKRLTEIELRMKYLEGREQYWKGRTWKNKPKELEDVESEIMFLCFEENHIKKCISYFEKNNQGNIKNSRNKTLLTEEYADVDFSTETENGADLDGSAFGGAENIRDKGRHPDKNPSDEDYNLLSSNKADFSNSEICENCGHERKEHLLFDLLNGGQDTCYQCDCKEFKPKKTEGCGINIITELGIIKCGEFYKGNILFCPNCQKKKEVKK